MRRILPAFIVLGFICPQGCAEPNTAASKPAASQPARSPVFRCDEPIFQLSNVWAGDKVQHVFSIRNDGTDLLRILNIEAACGCFVAEDYPRTLQPGQKGGIAVSLQTARGSTEVHKEMQVETNDPVRARVLLTIEGKITPRIQVDPAVGANWGRLYPGAETRKVVKLTNHFTRPMKLGIDPQSKLTDYTATLKETEPGQRAELTVVLKDDLSEGSHMQFLNLKTGFVEEPDLIVPCTLFVPPKLEVIPTGFSVYDKPGDVDRQTLQLRWNGRSPMRILDIKAGDPGVKTELTPTEAGRAYTLVVTMPSQYAIAAGTVEITASTDVAEQPLLRIPLQPRVLKTTRGDSQPQ